jgi:glycosidase
MKTVQASASGRRGRRYIHRCGRFAATVCAAMVVAAPCAGQRSPEVAPEWTRGSVCYEVFVRSFYDSDGDGVGDLNGLIEKLDYINDGDAATLDDLGAGCIWLMPIAESPSYHGYDVVDYYRVDEEYGTNEGFKRLIMEAHRRGIAVLVDMVLNHASSDHPHFQEALRDPRSPYREWFRWAATKPADLNPWGQSNWHRSPVRDEYYYAFFWEGMPDLNYESAAVQAEAKKVARFWLEEMEVDGFRLDAIPYLVEEDGEIHHTPGTHAILRDYAAYVREIAPDAFTIGEVWDSTGAMMAYYPDQLDGHFAFEVSDSILSAVRNGSARGLFGPALRLQRELPHHRWSPFLRNHDQTRTVTFLDGDLARARVAATLLLTFPGLPFVYYGEEIGMSGDKPDPRLRTPMHWSHDTGVGFSSGTPWALLHPDSLVANVAAQDSDPGSLLNVYRELIHLRAANSALGDGDLVPLAANHDVIAVYLRRLDDRGVMVVVNLGTEPLSGVTISSNPGALPPGHYVLQTLFGDVAPGMLVVGADGRIAGDVTLPTLGAMEGYVFELTQGPGQVGTVSPIAPVRR